MFAGVQVVANAAKSDFYSRMFVDIASNAVVYREAYEGLAELQETLDELVEKQRQEYEVADAKRCFELVPRLETISGKIRQADAISVQLKLINLCGLLGERFRKLVMEERMGFDIYCSEIHSGLLVVSKSWPENGKDAGLTNLLQWVEERQHSSKVESCWANMENAVQHFVSEA